MVTAQQNRDRLGAITKRLRLVIRQDQSNLVKELLADADWMVGYAQSLRGLCAKLGNDKPQTDLKPWSLDEQEMIDLEYLKAFYLEMTQACKNSSDPDDIESVTDYSRYAILLDKFIHREA